MSFWSTPQLTVLVGADNVELQGDQALARSIEPVFHVIRTTNPETHRTKWVFVGGVGIDPVQPADYALNVFQRDDWPPDAADMWGDYVAILFAMLLPDQSRTAANRVAAQSYRRVVRVCSRSQSANAASVIFPAAIRFIVSTTSGSDASRSCSFKPRNRYIAWNAVRLLPSANP